jgi:Spy/CpxP family protein refolding chaperone
MNKRLLAVFSLLAAVGLVAGLVSYAVKSLKPVPDLSETHDFDHWLHKQLELSDKQHAAMIPGEEAYHQRQRELIAEIEQLNNELSVAIVEERKDSPRVRSVIERVHAKQGELQNASILHIFEMEKELTPEQYDKLLRLASETLKSQK